MHKPVLSGDGSPVPVRVYYSTKTCPRERKTQSMRSNYSYKHPHRTPPAPRFVAWILLIGIIAVGGWFLLRSRGVDAAIRRGLALLEDARTAVEIEAALSRWENEYGREAGDGLIAALLDRYSPVDPRVRMLLVHVGGADYGDRIEDWKRWHDAQRRLRQGEFPKLQPGERVRVEKRWETPVGLTAWFSTLLPLDGAIYVASLGAGFGLADDAADGVVRVDGVTGESRFIFRPEQRQSADIIGISSGSSRIFVATRGGVVYAITPDGAELWSSVLDGVVFAPPMSLDVNRDGQEDVLVALRGGRVIALNGANGKTIWSLGGTRRGRSGEGVTEEIAACAVLAAGRIVSDTVPDVLVTYPDASVRVLLATSGAPKFERTERAGFMSGAVVCGDRPPGAPRAYLADRDSRIWSLTRSERRLDLVPTWLVAGGTTVVAAPRTFELADGVAPALLACTSGAPRGGGAVALLDATGTRWRYVTQGAVWSTPAVANLHRDREREAGRPEIIVCSVLTDAQGEAHGALWILTAEGHVVRSIPLTAPVDAAPLVCDVDGDQKLEIIVADRAGLLHCYSTDGVGPVFWGMHLGDPHNTSNANNAYSFGQTPFGYQSRWKPGF